MQRVGAQLAAAHVAAAPGEREKVKAAASVLRGKQAELDRLHAACLGSARCFLPVWERATAPTPTSCVIGEWLGNATYYRLSQPYVFSTGGRRA